MSFINAISNRTNYYSSFINSLASIPSTQINRIIETIEDEAVVPILRLITTGGPWFEVNDYLYQETNEDGLFIYSLVTTGTDTKVFAENYDITYDPIGQVFDATGVFAPSKWKVDDLGGLTTAYPTASNMRAQHWYDSFSNLMYSFNNPYYIPDTGGSSIDSEPGLISISNTFKIEPVVNDIEGNGFYYSINDGAFNFTTSAVVTRTYTRADMSVSVIVQGTGGSAFTASIDLVYIEPTINSVIITSNYNKMSR